MWKIIQEILPWLLAVLFVSQYVLPILLNKETWWLFKPTKKLEENNESSLKNEILLTKEIVDDTNTKVDVIVNKVENNLKLAEDLKKTAENLKTKK